MDGKYCDILLSPLFGFFHSSFAMFAPLACFMCPFCVCAPSFASSYFLTFYTAIALTSFWPKAMLTEKRNAATSAATRAALLPLLWPTVTVISVACPVVVAPALFGEPFSSLFLFLFFSASIKSYFIHLISPAAAVVVAAAAVFVLVSSFVFLFSSWVWLVSYPVIALFRLSFSMFVLFDPVCVFGV